MRCALCSRRLCVVSARLVALVLGLAGCGEPAEAPRAADPTEPSSSLVSGAPSDPVAHVDGPCTRDGLAARTPPELRAAVDALGWATVYDDACAMEAARASGDASGCDALEVRALREACRNRVAIEHRAPGSCHATERGHDPLCLALAARRRDLCRSTPLVQRAACEALLGAGIERCDRPDVPDAAACRALVEASSAVIGEVPEARPARHRAMLRTVRVIDLGARADRGEPVEEDLSDAERGAILRWEGCDLVLTLGEPDPEPLSRRTQRYVEVRWAGAMIEPGVALDVELSTAARAWVLRPEVGMAEGGGVLGGRGSVHVDALEPSLGAPVRLRLRGELPRTPGHLEVELDVETLVRDVIGERDCAAAGSPSPIEGPSEEAP